MSNNNWTPNDHAALEELQRRKAAFMRKNKEPLRAFVEREVPRSISGTAVSIDLMVDCLVSKADRLRDLLKPFDSGIRVASVTVKDLP